MDPLAHTLVGATIGETRLNRRTPLARATLMLAANFPDIDAGCMVFGRDYSLGFRRGYTHGILALIVGPVILTGLILLWDAKIRRPRGQEPVNPRAILFLACLGMATHPFLDWLNNYGIRLLMPFDDTWFYGDAIFIIDPWIWLMAGATVFLAHSRDRRLIIRWASLALVCSALVAFSDRVEASSKIVWFSGLALIAALRARGPELRPRHASWALAVLALYVGAAITGSQIARAQAQQWFVENGVPVHKVVVAPVPALPLRRKIVGQTEDHYHFAELDWLSSPQIRVAAPDIPIGDRVLGAHALAKRPGLEKWIRLPAFEVEPSKNGNGYTVRIGDVRSGPRRSGLGHAVVELPQE